MKMSMLRVGLLSSVLLTAGCVDRDTTGLSAPESASGRTHASTVTGVPMLSVRLRAVPAG